MGRELMEVRDLGKTIPGRGTASVKALRCPGAVSGQ